MKHFLTLLSLLPLHLFAQHLTALPAIEKTFHNDRTNTPAFVRFKSPEPSFSGFAEFSRNLYQMRAEDGLSLLRMEKDRIGFTHHRYQQTYAGTPVEWAVIIAHEKEGKLQSVNGDFYAGINPVNMPLLNPEKAVEAAIGHIGARVYKWELKEEEEAVRKALENPAFSYDPKTELVILPIGEGAGTEFRYAYKCDIYAHEPMGRWDIYVDAQTGEKLNMISKIHTDNSPGIAHTKYSGIRPIITDSIAPDQYRLRETSRGGGIETLNLNRTENFAGATDFIDSNNVWQNFNSFKDEVATDVHWGTAMTYDYYFNELGRNSYDNQGSKIVSYVHYRLNEFNAYWNGSFMLYGDGSGLPLTSLDVCGHELTHGVTQNSAGLIYQRESGGLNESFSDIFGEVVEFYSKPAEANWKIGEDFGALRNMANPGQYGDPDTYKGSNWINADDDCIPSNANDRCGVHTNSGVQNFWFYILSEGDTAINDFDSAYSVSGIGILTAAQIAYRNLTVYLTPSSKYIDACFYSIQSAIDLYGENSNEVIQTTNAWFAVGLGKRYSTVPTSDFSVKEKLCQPGSIIKFINNSGNATSFEWDFGDGSTSNALSPSYKYDVPGSYTVKLIAFNSSSSDTLIMPNYINIYTNYPVAQTCSMSATSPIGTIGIYNVNFNTINKTSKSAFSEGSYMDFTCERTTIEAGVVYPISITTNSSTSVYTRVWIDYNNDGVFMAPDELAFATDNTVNLHTGTVSAPLNAVLNTPLRMRVVSSRPTSNDPSNPCTVKAGQIEDYVVYVSPSTGITGNETSQMLTIYPNPSNGILHIQYENKAGTQALLELFNPLGQLILTEKLNSTNKTSSFDLSNYPAGIYYARINNGKQQQVSKIVLE